MPTLGPEGIAVLCAPWRFVLGDGLVEILNSRVEEVQRITEHHAHQVQAIRGFGRQLLELRI